MPSFQDSAVIFIIALLLFGPKKLPELARQLGKLMGEFRRASNDFRMQMEDELRVAEQADRQKEIAAIEAAAPVPALPADIYPPEEHPHLPPAEPDPAPEAGPEPPDRTAPLPIATAGDLAMMPPSTGLPLPRAAAVNGASANGESSPLGPLLDSIPETPDPIHATGQDVHG